MRVVFCACLFALCLAATVGCGSKKEASQNNPSDMKPGPTPGGKLTMDNVKRIQIGTTTLNDAKQTFGSAGEPTNDEKPGLMPGNKYVWKEDPKKVYISFGQDGKANGIAMEGFGDR